ncbi:helix-turn-helix domain-containing protein [Lactococcus lactis]|uniref:helix-turn-helix domain-containing protein n=1 Tax=Lactococcus lactis TaxID=1358 RepID=UPI001F59610B|nr:helix-turn-helix domain-containing protein [Lactococcus lactis]
MKTKIMFPTMVNYYRKLNNLTMEELAEKVNKTKSTISKWESGQRSPKIYEIEEIAQLFGVEPRIMMFGFKDNSNDKYISKTIEIMEQLSDVHKKTVLKTAMELLNKKNTSSNSKFDTLNVRAIEASKNGFWHKDNVSMSVNIPHDAVPASYDEIAIVLGDSMLPHLHHGDILFMKKAQNIDNDKIEKGQLGLYRTKDGNYIKKYQGHYLESLNPKYNNIFFKDDNNLKRIGTVIKTYRSTY